MLKVGLTGGIGSGKTTVSKVFSALNYPVFYSDLEAKKIMHSDEVRMEIQRVFGNEVYENGVLKRSKMAELIFNDQSLRSKLELIVHPKVREAFDEFVQQSQSKIVFNEAAILFETGANKRFDKIVYVSAPEDIRIKRVMARDQISEEAVRSRIKAQNPDEENSKLADFVIINDGKKSIINQVMSILEELS